MPARISSSERLAPWVGLPFLALVVLVIAMTTLPGSECDGSGSDTGPADILVAAIATVASLAAIAGGAFQLGRAASRGVGAIDGALSAGVVIAGLVLAAATGSDGNLSSLGQFMAYASLFAIVAFPVMLLKALVDNAVTNARLLTTVFLFGLGLGFYPLLTLFVLGASHGAFC